MTAESKQVFQVIPAIDLLDGEAVRLEQGDFERVALRAGDPGELVARLSAAGPPLLHLVDLEGSRSGRLRPDLIRDLIARADGTPVQASGGIRSVVDAETLLEAGASRVVVGTAAFANEGALKEFSEALGNRLVVAIDSRSGVVANAGWKTSTGLTVEEAAERCADAGVSRLLCTAIDRDGTLAGPDLDLLVRVRERSGLPVLAAGGVGSLADLRSLHELGLEGAIVGRALLEGRIPLTTVTAFDI